MTGSILGFMIFWIMVVAVLAAGWRQPETLAGRGRSGQAARPPAGWLEESPDAGSGGTRASPRRGATETCPPGGPPGPLGA